MAKLYLVGDSTVSKFNDVSYYYSRYGYGELLNKYFDIEIINYALSGRSSKSYILEKEYKLVINQLEKGDFLVIGFGHNDEKNDDPVRFTDANGDINDPSSFKYSLYNNYIKIAQEKGVTPILCTPTVRLDLTGKYEGEIIHICENGDYRKCILDLASQLGILGVDLTLTTRELMLNSTNPFVEHAMTKGKMENGKLTYDPNSVDKTHMSYLGAYHVACIFANAVNNSSSELKKYLKNDLSMPESIDSYNTAYVYKEYKTPDLSNYVPLSCFAAGMNFYGTAFGALDIVPNNNSGFIAKQNNDGTFSVGCANTKGKFNSSADGFAYLFKRISKKLNFEMSARLTVAKTANVKQSGFGLMLRNDAYINQAVPQDASQTNYIASGLITTDGSTYAIYSRKCTTELDKEYNVLDGFYKENDTASVYLKRLGQVVDVTIEYNGSEYKKTFTDFDILSVDPDYLFLGFFATKGTVIDVSHIRYKELGFAKEA